jgi:hypothetical protein
MKLRNSSGHGLDLETILAPPSVGGALVVRASDDYDGDFDLDLPDIGDSDDEDEDEDEDEEDDDDDEKEVGEKDVDDYFYGDDDGEEE